MKKPHWFNPMDFLALSVCALGGIAILIYALINGVQGPGSKEGLALLVLVDVCFVLFWGIHARDRKHWLDTFRWIPEYNLMVQANGYLLPADSEINGVVRAVIHSWMPFHPNAEDILRAEVNWIHFQKDLNETPMNPSLKKLNGFTVAGTHVVYVDFDNKLDALQRTSFAHELGHIIHGVATGSWDEGEHHKFMDMHSLS